MRNKLAPQLIITPTACALKFLRKILAIATHPLLSIAFISYKISKNNNVY